MMRSLRRGDIYGLLGLALFLGAWQVIGSWQLAGPSIPSLTDVWAVYREPWKLALLGRAAAATLLSAAIGLGVGCVLGTAVAVLAHLAAPLRRGLDQLSVIVNAVPAVALGPILIVTVGRDWTPATLAAIPVFFVIYVTASSGLRSASPRLMDVFLILGAGRLARLFYLEAPAALPSFLGGMRISVTAAIVGAIVGEWFGASTGLGIVILNTMLNFQIQLMWAAVLIAAATSLSVYGILGVCESYARRRFS
jgi:ABC-type nitrate/sulfonate/bicarbonate transport system permease component